MKYKNTEPYMVGFSLNLPVIGLCGVVFNRFYRLDIHSLMVGIFDPACELLPLYLLSDIKTVCCCGVGVAWC
jgi:hypothetical protein